MMTFATLAGLDMVAVGLATLALAATGPGWFRPRNIALRGFAAAVVILTLLALLRH